MKLAVAKINKDIERIKQNFPTRLIISFEKLFNDYVAETDQGKKIEKAELLQLLNEHFAEINAEFTIIINEFKNEIPTDDEGRLENGSDYCLILNENILPIEEYTLDDTGVCLAAWVPEYNDDIASVFYYVMAEKWKKYRNEKITKLYRKVNESLREIEITNTVCYG